MNAERTFPGSLVIGFYAWLLTLFGGMVLLDILYGRLVPDARPAFSAVSDFLLLFGFVTVLIAFVAIGFAWKSKAARNFLLASLLVVLLEFLIPVLLAPFVRDAEGFALGPWLRLVPGAVASILAFVGIYQYYRQKA